ncbi:MAG: 1-deoxy-D-xylulose-5-phosphate reductoisomerase [Deltaproteobacteria bacterium]|nr:1-deoxy-D-xylulose-5-phosphate reductoisomerase [Deltaproteobacteria bacterium]
MKRLSILGSTGSIGTNALSIVRMFPDRFRVTALAAKNNVDRLAFQIAEFAPELAVVLDAAAAQALQQRISPKAKTRIAWGEDGYAAAAALDDTDMVLAAMVGAAGLMPTLAAIDAGKDVALANKETLVMAGHIVMKRAAEKKVRVLPVDSEHSAIFQCLSGQRREDLEKIIITASGGPFIRRPLADFADIRPKDALNHPTWAMGRKISIDSSTLMNKGLEVLEAQHLFDVSIEKIEVVIHPQSLVHSMVAYRDGAVMAQLSVPDMKGAIAYALSYPERLPLNQQPPAFEQIGALNFEKPDLTRFPCLGLAFEACRRGGTCPAVLNAANEVAVAAFLEERIGFLDIPAVIEKTLSAHRIIPDPDLAQILEADRWARRHAGAAVISGGSRS